MGIRLIEPQLYDVIRMLGGNRRDEILQVGFPAAFPAIFAGLQISLSIAWTCVLSAELVSARSGLGFVIIQGMQLSKPALVLAGNGGPGLRGVGYYATGDLSGKVPLPMEARSRRAVVTVEPCKARHREGK